MAATYFLLEQSYAVFLLANAPKLPSRMARTKLILRKGEKGGKRRVLLSRTEREILAEKGRRPPSPVHHPFPEKKEMEEWVEAAGQLEGVGRSLSSLPTQQLVQMAVEAGPSKLGKEEPVQRKL